MQFFPQELVGNVCIQQRSEHSSCVCVCACVCACVCLCVCIYTHLPAPNVLDLLHQADLAGPLTGHRGGRCPGQSSAIPPTPVVFNVLLFHLRKCSVNSFRNPIGFNLLPMQQPTPAHLLPLNKSGLVQGLKGCHWTASHGPLFPPCHTEMPRAGERVDMTAFHVLGISMWLQLEYETKVKIS